MSDDSSKNTPLPQPQLAPWGALLGVGFGLLAFVGPQLLVGIIYASFHSGALEDTIPAAHQLYMYASSSLITLALLSALLSRYKMSLSGFFGSFKGSYLAYALAAFPVYMILSAVLGALMVAFNPAFNADQAQNLGFATDQSGFSLLIVFLALVIIPPVVEEILFRGFMFRGFLRSGRPVLSALCVSALFGLAHGQWNVGVDTFALSLVLCFLTYKTNSLWPSVILHSLKNMIAFILVFVITPDQIKLLLQQLW